MLKRLLLLVSFVVLSFIHPQPTFATTPWIKGVSIISHNPTDLSSSTFHQSMQKAKADNADTVTIVLLYKQDTVTSTTIYPEQNLPSDSVLVDAITYIHSLGMKVILKPHVDPADQAWRAYDNPSNWDTWFQNYGTILNHYGVLAQQNSVEAIIVGTEYVNLTNDSINPNANNYWKTLIANLRQVYSGKLSYSAHYQDEPTNIKFWSDLDFIGISAYYPLASQPDQSVDTYKVSWETIDQQFITPLANQYHLPIVFTEAGYRSIKGAGIQPSGGEPYGPNVDTYEQKALFNGLFAYWSYKPYFNGAVIWGWDTNPNAGGLNDNNYTPLNKPAEAEIAKWFGVSPLQALTTPTNLSPKDTNIATTSATLQWDPVPGAAYYSLRVNDLTTNQAFEYNYTSGGCTGVNGDYCNDNVATTSANFQGIMNHTYNWWVHARDVFDAWGNPGIATFAMSTATPTPTTPITPTQTPTPTPVGPTPVLVPLGGLNLDGYCSSLGLTGGAKVLNTVWVCSQNNTSFQMTAACQWQYPTATSVTAKQSQAGNPYTWSCFGVKSTITPTPTPTKQILGGLDLNSYCRSKGDTGAGLVSNNWVCTPSNAQIDMNLACSFKYPTATGVTGVQTRSGDPYSWACYAD